MKRTPFLYIRGLRSVDHTVFAVNDGQKYYIDPQFGRRQAYSSGQQVKRSIIEALDLPFAAMTFNWEIDKKDNKASQKEPHSPCDPSYPDQLLGGYMKAESGSFTIKRRSPLSVSAMRPLHPLLGGIEYPTENLTFDRTSHPEHHQVKVYWMEDKKRIEMTKEELDQWLTTNKRSLPNRAFIQDQTRASGLFVFDVAIDLRTLFCVSTNKLEPELFPLIEQNLRDIGWKDSKYFFGNCLLCPLEKRTEIIESLAHSIINWRITSNQSRTFSLMETIAIAISDNANKIAFSIRGELKDEFEKPSASPFIDIKSGAEIFQTPLVSSVIPGFSGNADALDKAEQYIIDYLNSFDYEKQEFQK
jgi:hypothetical protein